MVEPGTRYRRRQPQGDDWDVIEIRGFLNDELTVSSAVAFGPVVACTPDSLAENYGRVLPEDAERDDLAQRVAALEAHDGT